MLFDPHCHCDSPFLKNARCLPECHVDKYKALSGDNYHNMSAWMEDQSRFLGARESARLFFACYGDVKLPATAFEPLRGFYLGMCGPVRMLGPQESLFFCDRPYSMFMLLLDGRFHCTLENGAHFELGKNTFLAGDFYGMRGSSHISAEGGWNHITITISADATREHFGPGFAEDLERTLHCREKGAPRPVPILNGLASPDLISSGRRLIAMRKDGPFDAMELRSATLDFFTRILRNAASPLPAPVIALPEHDVLALTRLKERIERNCLEDVSIAELCASAGMSESKGTKAFKQLFNITIARHVHNCKMQHAHAMLSNRKRNVSECAFEVGYTNIGHFIAAYRKQYGHTPGSTFRQAS